MPEPGFDTTAMRLRFRQVLLTSADISLLAPDNARITDRDMTLHILLYQFA